MEFFLKTKLYFKNYLKGFKNYFRNFKIFNHGHGFKTILKLYFRVYQCFFKNSIMAESQYRLSFFLLIWFNFGWALVYIFLYVFIFKFVDQVGDWNYQRSLVLAATFLLVRALNSFLFKQNFQNFADLVYRGDLDFILIKPISSQFMVSLKKFYLRPFVRFIFAWLVLITVLVQNQIKLNIILVISYLLLLLISVIIVYSLWFISCCLVFWLGNIDNIHEVFQPVLRLTALPFDILPGVLKELFFLVIPLVFITTMPAKSLLGLLSWAACVYGFFISLVLFYLSAKVWHLALKYYVSAA